MSAPSVKVLITGANGQLGYALQQTAPVQINGGELELIISTRAQLDLSVPASIAAVLDINKPDIIINAAAYTAVDKAESEIDIANAINHLAVAEMAQWCAKWEKTLVQVSTDFVFDGKQSTAYLPEDQCNPLGVYGKTKHAGELAALNVNPSTYIVRTGWVYCEHGANFVKTILRLGAVSDQFGTPTYAVNLAHMIWSLIAVRPAQKIFHFSDAGVASWFDFAEAIFTFAEQKKMLLHRPQLKPIPTSDYPTPAQRPGFSVLDKNRTWQLLTIKPVHWQQALAQMMERLI
jgi:dTDP-4-dehydrorhamnose reductase